MKTSSDAEQFALGKVELSRVDAAKMAWMALDVDAGDGADTDLEGDESAGCGGAAV